MFWFETAFPYVMFLPTTKKKLSEYENSIEFQNVFCNLVNLALDKFHFDNLPETCNERYFKKCLLFNGKAAIINDQQLGYLSLGITSDAQEVTLYGEWDRINAYGADGFSRSYTCYVEGGYNEGVEAVICRDNDMCYPMVNYIIIMAERLCSTMRTVDVTARKLKTPYFIVAAEEQKSAIKKILDDIDFNQDSIITNKSVNPNMFQVLPTNVRAEALSILWEHYYNLQTEARTYLGIPSVPNRYKKERMVVAEAQADDSLASSNLAYRMHSYEKFCDIVNAHFGLNISIRFEDGGEFAIRDLQGEKSQDDMGTGGGDVQDES